MNPDNNMPTALHTKRRVMYGYQ